MAPGILIQRRKAVVENEAILILRNFSDSVPRDVSRDTYGS
jgi:hypothetical protein